MSECRGRQPGALVFFEGLHFKSKKNILSSEKSNLQSRETNWCKVLIFKNMLQYLFYREYVFYREKHIFG